MTIDVKNRLVEALKLIKEVCKQYDECSLCPMGDEDCECILESKPPASYLIIEADVWRALK